MHVGECAQNAGLSCQVLVILSQQALTVTMHRKRSESAPAVVPTHEPELPARYYLRLAELLAELGIDLERLIEHSGVGVERVLDASSMLTLTEVQNLSRSACQLADLPELGLLLGSRLEPASHDVLGWAMQQAPTIDAALRLASRYFSLLSPGFRMRYRLDSTVAEVELMPSLPFEHEALRLHLDTVLAAALTEVRYLAKRRLVPRSVDLGWSRPEYAQRYKTLIGRMPQFSALAWPGVRFWFDADDMLAPTQQADPTALAEARLRCERRVQRTLRGAGLAAWTAMMLHHAAHGMPKKGELAALLGMSARSYTRHLAREQCSFRQLSLQSRLRLAHASLAEGNSTITDLAHRLGYSDAANFSRAFRQVHHCAPRAWRRDGDN